MATLLCLPPEILHFVISEVADDDQIDQNTVYKVLLTCRKLYEIGVRAMYRGPAVGGTYGTLLSFCNTLRRHTSLAAYIVHLNIFLDRDPRPGEQSLPADLDGVDWSAYRIPLAKLQDSQRKRKRTIWSMCMVSRNLFLGSTVLEARGNGSGGTRRRIRRL
jgi:hypothetical protein